MATHKVYDVVATVGEYPDPQDPTKTKKRYKNCGAVFVRDNGSQFMKLDTIPCGEWSGWLAFYEPKQRQDTQQQQQSSSAQAAQPAQQTYTEDDGRRAQHADGSTVEDDEFDDDIPF